MTPSPISAISATGLTLDVCCEADAADGPARAALVSGSMCTDAPHQCAAPAEVADSAGSDASACCNAAGCVPAWEGMLPCSISVIHLLAEGRDADACSAGSKALMMRFDIPSCCS